MTIDEIEYFFKILESGSISRASEGLYISRQGLGKSLENLEKDVGATLFVRTSKGIQLTEFGEYFAAEARPIVESFRRLSDVHERFKISTSKSLRIAMPRSEVKWSHSFKSIISKFKTRRPDAHIEFFDDTTLAYVDENIFYNYDAVLTMNDSNVRTLSNLESIWMGDLEYDICIGPNHRLSGLEHIPEEEMLKEAFPR